MKHLLVGNGINIQFGSDAYSTNQIVLRILKNCDREDFPSHIIVDFPYLLKNYIGRLYLEARNIIVGRYDEYVTCNAEQSSLNSFKEQYGHRIKTLRITDIGFEDYYLIHDLVCHKYQMKNPEQFHVREALRIAYLFSVYNDGDLNLLHERYPQKFIEYLKQFDSVFTTNYDSNIDSVVSSNVYHIHGHFDTLSAVYDENSFRNQLPDAPIEKVSIDTKYYYLYSNALSTHCGEYKEFQLKQYSLANDAVEKLASAYFSNTKVKADVDNWIQSSSTITANMGHAVILKATHPELSFIDDYHFDKLSKLEGRLDILGLSPWNDFHIFEQIDKTNLISCTYFYYSENQCDKIKELLPTLNSAGVLRFCSAKQFWEEVYED